MTSTHNNPDTTTTSPNGKEDTLLSIYIPRVFVNITSERISNIFNMLNIGEVKYVDLVPRENTETKVPYHMAFIHFNRFYDNSASKHFLEKVLDPDQDARIVYDEPWYWICLPNRNPKPDSIHALEMRVDQLEERISELTNQLYSLDTNIAANNPGIATEYSYMTEYPWYAYHSYEWDADNAYNPDAYYDATMVSALTSAETNYFGDSPYNTWGDTLNTPDNYSVQVKEDANYHECMSTEVVDWVTDFADVDAGGADAGVADAGGADAGVADTGVAGASAADTGVADSSDEYSSDTNSSVSNSSVSDSSVSDSSVSDSSVSDSSVSDYSESLETIKLTDESHLSPDGSCSNIEPPASNELNWGGPPLELPLKEGQIEKDRLGELHYYSIVDGSPVWIHIPKSRCDYEWCLTQWKLNHNQSS